MKAVLCDRNCVLHTGSLIPLFSFLCTTVGRGHVVMGLSSAFMSEVSLMTVFLLVCNEQG